MELFFQIRGETDVGTISKPYEKKLNSGFYLRSWTDTVKKFNVKSN